MARIRGFYVPLALSLLLATFAAGAQEGSAAGPAEAREAVRTCTKCHDENSTPPVLGILKTPHAVMADERTPFGDRACVTCHGASLNHMEAPADGGKRASPDIVFGKKSHTDANTQNEKCIGCHESGLRMHWKGSMHEAQGGVCTDCHNVHSGSDPVLAKITQPEVCLNCHKEKRAEIHRPSTHPIVEGKVACSDCHNPHGSNGPTLLAASTVNETCYTCHAEKRGPFLWEHQPVREDCTICHKPHGSVNESLLKARGPWLCQQCHMAQFHPSTAYSGTGLPGSNTPSGAQQMLGKNCLNCHVQVHGSNHPSGVRKTR